MPQKYLPRHAGPALVVRLASPLQGARGDYLVIMPDDTVRVMDANTFATHYQPASAKGGNGTTRAPHTKNMPRHGDLTIKDKIVVAMLKLDKGGAPQWHTAKAVGELLPNVGNNSVSSSFVSLYQSGQIESRDATDKDKGLWVGVRKLYRLKPHGQDYAKRMENLLPTAEAPN